MAIKAHPSFAVHPGGWLRSEIADPAGIPVARLAEHLRVSEDALSALFDGHSRLSADMALRFERAFGLRAETLVRMQADHDLANARARGGDWQIAAYA